MTAEHLAPTPGLLCSVVASTWIDHTPPGDVAFLLIAHPPHRCSDSAGPAIEPGMRGLAAGLGLALPSMPLPDLGRRLFMQGHTSALLLVDGCDYFLRVPTKGQWARFVADGGPVVLALGLDALESGADRDTVEQYLTRSVLADRLLMGKTYFRRPGSDHAITPGGDSI